jgi:ABC-2 type transport system ATP-binding protein
LYLEFAVDKVDYLMRAFAAYRDANMVDMITLFADDAVWPALDPAAQGCRDRGEIEAMLRRGIDRGVTGELEELTEIGDAVVAGFRSAGEITVGDAGRVQGAVFHVLRFDGPCVVRSDPYPGRDQALRAAIEPRGRGETVLAVDSVTKRYRRTTALRDISLDVCRGEAVAIVGENGAGKSTLLRICAGLENPDQGTSRRAVPVGYCPQVPALFDLLTAEEHVGLFCASRPDGSVAAASARETLAALGFPPGSPTLARDMSGGERQKLNLALALLGQPGLLLLDEPYQGFDHGSYLDFWHFVDEWRDQGKAVVIVTHLLTELHRVDRIIELHRPQGHG